MLKLESGDDDWGDFGDDAFNDYRPDDEGAGPALAAPGTPGTPGKGRGNGNRGRPAGIDGSKAKNNVVTWRRIVSNGRVEVFESAMQQLRDTAGGFKGQFVKRDSPKTSSSGSITQVYVCRWWKKGTCKFKVRHTEKDNLHCLFVVEGVDHSGHACSPVTSSGKGVPLPVKAAITDSQLLSNNRKQLALLLSAKEFDCNKHLMDQVMGMKARLCIAIRKRRRGEATPDSYGALNTQVEKLLIQAVTVPQFEFDELPSAMTVGRCKLEAGMVRDEAVRRVECEVEFRSASVRVNTPFTAHTPFVCGSVVDAEYSSTSNDGKVTKGRFVITISSENLLLNLYRCSLRTNVALTMYCDATYRLNNMGYGNLVLAVKDQRCTHHIVAMAIVSSEDEECHEEFFRQTLTAYEKVVDRYAVNGWNV